MTRAESIQQPLTATQTMGARRQHQRAEPFLRIERRAMNRTAQQPPRGFTLIELLVASVLAATLMLALVGLLRMTHAQSKAAERILQQHPPLTLLADQLRRDFGNARQLDVGPQRVRLLGYSSMDHATRRQTYLPAEVTYAIAETPAGSVLVRHETQRSEHLGRHARADLLWLGATAIEVSRFDEPTTGETESSVPGMSPMPARLVVTIYDRDHKPLCIEQIFHHQTSD